MASRKPSAKARQIKAFEERLFNAASAGNGDPFEAERQHQTKRAKEREAALRKKACESKNRYASKYDAEEAARLCAEHGTTGLHCYRCSYCNGWHLTSHPSVSGGRAQ